jgi:hypothetical protein
MNDSTRIAMVADALARMDASDRDEVVDVIDEAIDELREIASLLKIAETTYAHGGLVEPDGPLYGDDRCPARDAMEWCDCGEMRPTPTEAEMEGRVVSAPQKENPE